MTLRDKHETERTKFYRKDKYEKCVQEREIVTQTEGHHEGPVSISQADN